MIRRLCIAALSLALLALPVLAVQPDEILEDPALELRARDLSKGLRCLVCRNESIDESNADLARDLRVLVRERLVAGDSDDEVIAYIVERFGEYVLLRPRPTGSNWLLWGAGPAMLLVAVIIGFGFVRARASAPGGMESALNEDEKERLAQILKE